MKKYILIWRSKKSRQIINPKTMPKREKTNYERGTASMFARAEKAALRRRFHCSPRTDLPITIIIPKTQKYPKIEKAVKRFMRHVK